MRDLLKLLLIAAVASILAACGGGAPTGAVQPTTSPPLTGDTRPTAAPEPTGAPQPTAEPAHTRPTVPPEPTGASQPTAQPEQARPTEPTGASRPTAANGTALVIYHKTGGIMGVDETLTIHEDGTLEFQSRGGASKTAKAPASMLDKLRALIASPEFGQLQAQYPAAGADLFIYDITVPGGTPAHVVTMDGVENPAILAQLIEILSMLRKMV